MKKKLKIDDIAKLAGVSLASVSHYFHRPERLGKEVYKKIEAVVQKNRYQPPFIEKRQNFGNIGLLIDQHRGPFGEFYSEIILGILEEALKLKWNISIELYDSTKLTMAPMIAEKKINGLILLSKHSDAFIKKIIEKKIPYCVVDYLSEGLKHHSVRPDWYGGAQLAVNVLIKKGHQKIAMIHSSLDKGGASLERVKAYNDILQEHGLEQPSGYLRDGGFNYEKSYQETKKLLTLPQRPTAIFYATDVMALGGIKALKTQKIKIPDEISVIGFDHIQWPYYMESPVPPLTTVGCDRKLLGAEALKMVDHLIQHQKTKTDIVLPMKLFEKNSISPLR